MTAVQQQSDIIFNALFRIFLYTRPPTIRSHLLLQSKFWFDWTQCLTPFLIISTVTVTVCRYKIQEINPLSCNRCKHFDVSLLHFCILLVFRTLIPQFCSLVAVTYSICTFLHFRVTLAWAYRNGWACLHCWLPSPRLLHSWHWVAQVTRLS